jgi:hypothetical protein
MKAGCDQPATPGDATTGEQSGSDQGWKCEASQERDTFGITGDEGLNFLWQQRHPEQAFGLDVCWFINTVSRLANRAQCDGVTRDRADEYWPELTRRAGLQKAQLKLPGGCGFLIRG